MQKQQQRQSLSSSVTGASSAGKKQGRRTTTTMGDDTKSSSTSLSSSLPPLPLSASCSTICDIASQLLKQCLGLELYDGAVLVAESVSTYKEGTCYMRQRNRETRHRINELHLKKRMGLLVEVVAGFYDEVRFFYFRRRLSNDVWVGFGRGRIAIHIVGESVGEEVVYLIIIVHMIEVFVGVLLLKTVAVIAAVVVSASGGVTAPAASSIVVAAASSIDVVVFVVVVGRAGVVSALTATVIIVISALEASFFFLNNLLEGVAPVFGVLATVNWTWLERAIRLVSVATGVIVVGTIAIVVVPAAIPLAFVVLVVVISVVVVAVFRLDCLQTAIIRHQLVVVGDVEIGFHHLVLP
mmetsp:Transcript_37788/g.55266  ORF Transcript_37788/g.55266 Transcript_37788/m.55266 type:complete len:353 (+) Transcript_37788:3213-4271(+)